MAPLIGHGFQSDLNARFHQLSMTIADSVLIRGHDI